MNHQFSQDIFQACVEACNECAGECEKCATRCLEESEVQTRREMIQFMRDCADVCSLTAKLVSRQSSFMNNTASLCAQICRASAEEASHHETSYCQSCADICFQTAEACERVATRLSDKHHFAL